MNSKIEKWADRLQKEELVDFAIEHLQKNKVALPADNRRRSVAKMPRREQLVEMVLGLRGSDANILRYERLLASVRQERTRRGRVKEKRLIKRLDLRDSVCDKLAAVSRATRLRQSTVVENLINDETAVWKTESLALKGQRQKLKEQERILADKEAKLEASEKQLSHREEGVADRLSRLEAYENLVSAILACGANDIHGVVNVSEEKGIEHVYTFTASRDLTREIRDVKNAWKEVRYKHGAAAKDG